MPAIDHSKLAQAIYQHDLLTFSSFFEKDASILGYSVEGYFNFITRNLNHDIYKDVEIQSYLLDIKPQHYILQIFFNQILILEENFELDGITNLIKSTKYSTDCFGKLVIFNDKIERLLTIRPKRGVSLKGIRFIDEDLEEELSVNPGSLFNDGYLTGHFKLRDDNLKSKIVRIKIITDNGIENQYLMLRGLDYPFFSVNRPEINGNVVILTEDVKKIYKINVTFKDDTEEEIEFLSLDSNVITFEKEVKKVYQSINGCAMNYFIENT